MDKACETSRCLIEAEDVYYAGHVVECAIETARDARYDFLAFVLQTTAISSAPHEVKITVCDAAVDRTSCSCKAGYDNNHLRLFGRNLHILLVLISWFFRKRHVTGIVTFFMFSYIQCGS